MSASSKKSFSQQVKDELKVDKPLARHCTMAKQAAKKFFTLQGKTYNISHCKKTNDGVDFEDISRLNELLVHECCKKEFLREAFLTAGSISDPQKSYHLEIVSDNEELIDQTYEVIKSFGIYAGRTKRRNNYVIYLKEGVMIVEFLGLVGAPLSLMELENVRILKDMRNDLNRKVNCEAANIKKTINAAMTQIEEINFIDGTCGIEALPNGLREVAIIRRKYPEASLVELGELLNPPVGKSGVNHRLRRISQIAKRVMSEENFNEERNSY